MKAYIFIQELRLEGNIRKFSSPAKLDMQVTYYDRQMIENGRSITAYDLFIAEFSP